MIDDLFDRVYVISMQSSTNRREHIRRHFAETGINNYVFFDAFAGAELDLEAMKESRLVETKPSEHGGVELKPGEVGASLSHIRVYEMARDLGQERILVCEDDIRFCPDANERIGMYMDEVPADWDIVHFQSLRPVGNGDGWDRRRIRVSRHVYRGYNEGAGASCYALTRRCMGFLLKHAYPISKAPDGLTNWPTGWWPECGGYNGYIVDPLPCRSGIFASDVGERKANVPAILYREWLKNRRKWNG